MTTETTDTTTNDKTTTEPTMPKMQKTSTITLTAADGSTMQIVAERQGAAARTYVLTIGPDKKSSRGMSQAHPSFDVAVAHAAKLAEQAAKLGWVRRVPTRGFTPKPDDFSSIPAAPKATTAAPAPKAGKGAK